MILLLSSCSAHLSLDPGCDSAISVVAMTGAAIVIDNAAATDTIRSVKERVYAANRELPVRRQRLVYRPGPRGLEALADDETLGGAGVARNGTAELDVLRIKKNLVLRYVVLWHSFLSISCRVLFIFCMR